MRTLLGAASVFALVALAPAVLAAPSEDAGWVADYDQGLALAVEQQKDLFVEFTGSDWCPPCKALYAEVFSKPEFAEAMKDDFVLVKLDFPRSAEVKAKVPNAARNAEIRDQFAISGYPTVLLMTTDGTVYAKSVGYRGDGLEGYIDFVREQHTAGKAAITKVLGLVERFEAAADAPAKIAVIEDAHAMIADLGDSPLGERLVPLVRAGFELDPKDEKGLVTRGLTVLFESGAATADDAAKAKEFDADNGRGLLERAVMWEIAQVRGREAAEAALASLDAVLVHGIKDDDVAKSCLATAVNWCSHQLEDMDRARGYATKLKERFPDDAELAEWLDEVLAEQ